MSLPSADILNSPIYYNYGLSDAVTYHLMQREKISFLTADLPLANLILNHGFYAINFHTLRQL